MQVVILCGGLGSRIREVNSELPKPLIPIGGQPILWHIMKHYSHYGFNDFVLCLGYKSDAIKRYFVDYHRNLSDFTIDLGHGGSVEVHHKPVGENWRVTLVETGLNSMTGCRVKRIERYIKGKRFLLTYGDGVSDVDLEKLIDHHVAQGRVATVTAVPPPGRFGEIKIDEGQVTHFMEKPEQASGLISGGFFVFERSVFDWLEDSPSLVLEKEPLNRLTMAGELSAYRHDGFWHCMDNSRDYQSLNEMWDAGHAPWKCWESAGAAPRLRRAA
jgi:glucose-1-phosphate cytidylyltransferase